MSYIFFIGGLLMCLFRKQLTKSSTENQNKPWRFYFGKKEVKAMEIFTFIIGLGFALMGLLDILGLIHMRKIF